MLTNVNEKVVLNGPIPMVTKTRRNTSSSPDVLNKHNGLLDAAARNSLVRNLPSLSGSFQ